VSQYLAEVHAGELVLALVRSPVGALSAFSLLALLLSALLLLALFLTTLALALLQSVVARLPAHTKILFENASKYFNFKFKA
jgi:hypothetical protein